MKTIENNKLIAEFLGYIDNGCSEDGFLIHPITNYDVEISRLKYRDWETDRKSTRLNSSHSAKSRMPSSA